jgi:hypothetical protein
LVWLWFGFGLIWFGFGLVWLWSGLALVWFGFGLVWLWFHPVLLQERDLVLLTKTENSFCKTKHPKQNRASQTKPIVIN